MPTTRSHELQLDLAAAYPRDAGIASWVRTIRLARGDCVQVNDDFTLREASSDIVQHLMTPCDVELLEEGQFRLRNAKSGTDLLVRYEPPELRVSVETIQVEDASLSESCGDRN